jgi:hypothetical protein
MRDPIARECEPLDAEWLSNMGAITATIAVSNRAFTAATVRMLITTTHINKARQSCTNIYFPRPICDINERSEVGSRAAVTEVPRIFAKVVNIFRPCPSAQISAIIAAEFRNAFADSDNFPAFSSNRKAIASKKPIVAKLAVREMNLPTVVNEVISGPAEFGSAAREIIAR